jgi:transposase-like protein
MVQEVACRCKTAWEMSRELRPRWSGYLVVDEKMVSVAGHQQWFYGAFDLTGDVVHWRAVPALTVNDASEFLEEVTALRYPCRAVVTDLDTALTRAVEETYREKPHQYCLKHAQAALDTLVGYRPQMRRGRRTRKVLRDQFERLPLQKGIFLRRAKGAFLRHWQQTRQESARTRALHELHDHCQKILFAKDEREAREHLRTLRRRRSVLLARKWKAVRFLERHWDRLMMHHRVRGLPSTNNMAESFNRQLERRLKVIEGFQHRTTAIPYMNLLVAYLRLKPYTDCRGNRRPLNGRNRLQAAGLKISSTTWLTKCLNNTKISNR